MQVRITESGGAVVYLPGSETLVVFNESEVQELRMRFARWEHALHFAEAEECLTG